MVQEIGQATSVILDSEALVHAIAAVMERRLDFDRGTIMLAREGKLIYSAGYGHDEEEEIFLSSAEFHLDKPDSKGVFVRAYREQNPFLVTDIKEDKGNLSKRSLEIVSKIGAESLICVPIVYERN